MGVDKRFPDEKIMDIFTRIELLEQHGYTSDPVNNHRIESGAAITPNIVTDTKPHDNITRLIAASLHSSEEKIKQSYDINLLNQLLVQNEDLNGNNNTGELKSADQTRTINKDQVDIECLVNALELSKKNLLCKDFIINAYQFYITKYSNELKQHKFNYSSETIVISSFIRSLIDDLTKQVFRVLKHEIAMLLSSAYLTLTDKTLWLEEIGYAIGQADFITYFNDKYPVLQHRCQLRIKAICQSLTLLFTRFECDYLSIKQHFFHVSMPLTLLAVERGLGDSHNQGETVCILHFNNDNRLVYKPRTLTTEKAFEHYIKWINDNSHSDLKVANILPGIHYGWQEYIRHKPIENKQQAQNYYYRYGMLIAACHAINITDIHYENLIANGEYPVIIDLETLAVKPEINIPTDSTNSADATKAINATKELCSPIFGSVLFTGLINESTFGQSVNVAPLGSAVTMFSFDDITLDEQGTGIIEVSHQHKSIKHCVLTQPNSKALDAADFIEPITTGFSHVYNLVLANKGELLTSEIERIFAEVTPRIVLQPTKYYGKILALIARPESSVTSMKQERILFNLLNKNHGEGLPATVSMAEWACIINGDIPYFCCLPQSRDIKSGTGRIIKNILANTAVESIKNTILLMTAAKEQSEIVVITNSLLNNNNKGQLTLARNTNAIYSAIADNIRINDNNLSFVDIFNPRTGAAGYRDMSRQYDFNYSLPGICFSLAYYEKYAAPTNSAAKSSLIANHIMQHMDIDHLQRIGINEGAGGIVYLFSHLAYLEQNQTYLSYAGLVFNHLLKALPQDRMYDVFSGAAGALLAGMSLYQLKNDGHLLMQLEQIGDHLLDASTQDQGRRYWTTNATTDGASTGFAHGCSGIAYALLKLYQLTSKTKYLDAVVQSKAFIDSCFKENQWLETPSADVPFNAWCHGSVGITLFLLEYGNVMGRESISNDMTNSIELTLRHISASGDCLCHGTYGNLELLLSLHNQYQFFQSDDDLNTQIQSILASRAAKPINGGSRGTDYSLFNGISGIGYQLLRCEWPNKIPSILTFSVPGGNA
ncbi:MAG: type 2 lantibiotic biosynthesis protein LanM [Paraglaciecola sp.]|jgi:type 2 lantibiotic biosynthesis protein LanM